MELNEFDIKFLIIVLIVSSVILIIMTCLFFNYTSKITEKDNQTITNLTLQLSESKQTITDMITTNQEYNIELNRYKEGFNMTCGKFCADKLYSYINQIEGLQNETQRQYFLGYNQGYVDCRAKWDTNIMANADCSKENLTYTGIKGIYWSNDDFYCVYAKNQDKTDQEKKDEEMYCHSLVQDNYERFCGSQEDILIKYGGCTPCQ